MLFTLSTWHLLGKLRLHTDTTLGYFEAYTVELGERFRFFADVTCPNFKTLETKKEAAARKRRDGAKASTAGSAGRKPKTFNLQVIKFHLVGHMPSGIRTMGTTDNYSTHTVGYYMPSPLCSGLMATPRVNRNIAVQRDTTNEQVQTTLYHRLLG